MEILSRIVFGIKLQYLNQLAQLGVRRSRALVYLLGTTENWRLMGLTGESRQKLPENVVRETEPPTLLYPFGTRPDFSIIISI